MDTFLTTKTPNSIVLCVIDCTLIGINHFSSITYKYHEIHKQCKVTFGLKYIFHIRLAAVVTKLSSRGW